jgi:putative phosphoesterase
MKRIAVLSDIHGNILALEKVVQDLEQRDIDLIVNLGDHLSGPLWPKETVDFLKQQTWIQIRGNHERQLITQNPKELGLSDLYAYQILNSDDLNWLRTLSPFVEIDKEISIFHGSPKNDLTYLLETIENGRPRLATSAEVTERINGIKSPVILCGHSHIPRVIGTKEGQLIVNPGSVGLPAYDDTKPEPHRMETGSPHARYAIIQEDDGRWNVELIAIWYDHQKAAEQARRNKRSDWQIGLQTGYMR